MTAQPVRLFQHRPLPPACRWDGQPIGHVAAISPEGAVRIQLHGPATPTRWAPAWRMSDGWVMGHVRPMKPEDGLTGPRLELQTGRCDAVIFTLANGQVVSVRRKAQ